MLTVVADVHRYHLYNALSRWKRSPCGAESRHESQQLASTDLWRGRISCISRTWILSCTGTVTCHLEHQRRKHLSCITLRAMSHVHARSV